MCLFVCVVRSAPHSVILSSSWDKAAKYGTVQCAVLLNQQWLGDHLAVLAAVTPTWAGITTGQPRAFPHQCVQRATDGGVHVKLFIRPNADELCGLGFFFVCVHACQWPRGTPGPRNYLNGHSCTSIATGCFNGGTLWAGEQGNDRSGRRNALILSQRQEGMLPLSDGLIAPALIDRQPRPLRSPGNTGLAPPPGPHSTTHNHWHAHKSKPVSLFLPWMTLFFILEVCRIWINAHTSSISTLKKMLIAASSCRKVFRQYVFQERKKRGNGWGESKRAIRARWKACLPKNGLSLFWHPRTVSHSHTLSGVSRPTAECIHGQIL